MCCILLESLLVSESLIFRVDIFFVQSGPVIPMPVPASYNDITQSKELRDFVGGAWYDNEFYVPPELANKRIVMRIDSAHYNAIVVSMNVSI